MIARSCAAVFEQRLASESFPGGRNLSAQQHIKEEAQQGSFGTTFRIRFIIGNEIKELTRRGISNVAVSKALALLSH